MSYLVLARKYRPETFSDVSGQDHITRTLLQSIKKDRIGHAYLFAGPRGVGKTSIARILAKAINCSDPQEFEPCLKCDNCLEITQGTSLAVREIDGASHNSVDNVRELIDSFRSLPPPGCKNKIYIIDEVHMLSTSAFNALLKSLEEPPPNTVFILATTEIHKIPDTVISRCQRHEFRALSVSEIDARIKSVCKREKIKITPEACRVLARMSDGSMRDAQSLLDRARAFCDDNIVADEVSKALGIVERSVLLELSRSIFAQEVSQCLTILQRVFASGLDPTLLLREFVHHWRELLIAKFDSGKHLTDLGLGKEEAQELRDLLDGVDGHDIQDLAHLAREGADSAVRSAYPEYSLEALVVRMATREKVKDLGSILGKMRTSLSKSAGKTKSQAAPARAVSVEKRSAPSRAPVQKKVEVKKAVEKNPPPPLAKDSAVDALGSPRDSLDWAEFVGFVGKESSPMLSEHLKRLSLQKFVAGNLDARGPEFCIAHLQKAETQKKIKDLLARYSGVDRWTFRFSTGEGTAAEPGSISAEQARTKQEDLDKRKKEMLEHPRMKKLTEAFPGSMVEGIKVKGA